MPENNEHKQNKSKIFYILYGTALMDHSDEPKVKKEKVRDPNQKPNRALDLLTKEYKYENLFLLILAIFAIVLGALLVKQVLNIDNSFPVIGEFQKQFAWVLIALGIISLVLVAWPFYKPSFGEIKHIRGYKRAEYLINVLRVVVFILILVAFFWLCDYLLQDLFLNNVQDWVKNLVERAKK